MPEPSAPAPEAIETARCWLEPVIERDRHDVEALYANEAVRRHLGGLVVGTAFEKRFASMLEGAGSRTWAIREKLTGSFVGLVMLTQHNDGRDVEISYQLLPGYWRRGLAAEAISTTIGYAWNVMGLPRIVAETQAVNRRSRRLLERVGMIASRRLRRYGEEQIVYELDPGVVSVGAGDRASIPTAGSQPSGSEDQRRL